MPQWKQKAIECKGQSQGQNVIDIGVIFEKASLAKYESEVFLLRFKHNREG